jgi:MoaA/NifB/PqqE/SkfB family radical SAM enzyme
MEKKIETFLSGKRILINIEPTTYCGANCVMCPRSIISQHGYMSTSTLAASLRSVSSSFVYELSFAGRGEPTLHRELPNMLAMARATRIPVSIVTTAVNMGKDKREAIIANADIIRISISSFNPATFRKVHRGLNFDKVWANIHGVAKAAPEKIVAHLTGGSMIYEHLPETVHHLRDIGVDRIFLFPLWNRGEDIESAEDKEHRVSIQERLGLKPSEAEYGGGPTGDAFQKDWQEGLLSNPQYCAVGDSSISIQYDGTVVGCFQDFGRKSPLANVADTILYDFWQARKGLLGKMAVCEKCDVNRVSLIGLKKLEV